MFGPNHQPEIHHREKAFSDLYEETVKRFKSKFNLDESWDVFFVTGSGTLALETVIFSIRDDNVNVVTNGHFSDRLENMAMVHGKEDYVMARTKIGVQYETAESKYNKLETGNPDVVLFVDNVSAFPYYNPTGDIWVTVNSKQLGGNPGLSIIVAKKSLFFNDYFKPSQQSYLSLMKHKEKQEIFQTPHTPAIQLISELNSILEFFNLEMFRKMIDERRRRLSAIIPPHMIVGEGPVLTLKSNWQTKRLASEFDLYNNSGRPQIFLWSGKEIDYERVIKEAERIF